MKTGAFSDLFRECERERALKKGPFSAEETFAESESERAQREVSMKSDFREFLWKSVVEGSRHRQKYSSEGCFIGYSHCLRIGSEVWAGHYGIEDPYYAEEVRSKIC